MAKKKRGWAPRELRLVPEYCLHAYPNDTHIFRVRLGEPAPGMDINGLSDAAKRLVGVTRRYCDAVVLRPDEVVIIECSIPPEVGHLSKLELYRALWPYTPEFQQYQHLPVRAELVLAIYDPFIAEMGRRRDIRVLHFCPDWCKQYIEELAERKRQAARVGRNALTGA